MEVPEGADLSGEIGECVEVEEEEVEDPIGKLEVKGSLRPTVGMTFESVEEAKNAYNDYASEIGFGIKSRSSYKRGGIVWKHIFACVKQGWNKSNAKYYSGLEARCGCKAQMSVRLCKDNKWHISSLQLEHNHIVSPSKSRFFSCNKVMGTAVKKRLVLQYDAGIPVCKSFMAESIRAGGIENLQFDERDVRNHIDADRRLKFGTGDAEAIQNYFVRKQKQHQRFFHSMHAPEGHLTHVFWADARARSAYEYFGDVVCFDTTYLTNKYDMPFAPFVGVNHHGQSVLLGCALLGDESIASYEWLFSTWLACMGKEPKAIITDQCPSIAAGIARVFPNARHRLCLWHIMKKVPEKMGGLKDKDRIISALNRLVYDCLTVEEFEAEWEEFMCKFEFKDGSRQWLCTLYDLRYKWVPVFLKDCFWAGMTTTQRSEGMNHFFKGYLNSKTTLQQFIIQYDLATSIKNAKEDKADFESFHKERRLVSDVPYERQMRVVYTNKLLKKFHEQRNRMFNCKVVGVTRSIDQLTTYEVRDITVPPGLHESPKRVYQVVYNEACEELKCICGSYESCGILCCHALCVFYDRDVTEIPTKYIMDRWRKDFKRKYAREKTIVELDTIATTVMERHDAIITRCNHLAELGSTSSKKLKMVYAALKELEMALIDTNDDDEGTLPSTQASSKQIIKDPHARKRKGRPRKNRLKGPLENGKKGKKVQTCCENGASMEDNAMVPLNKECEECGNKRRSKENDEATRGLSSQITCIGSTNGVVNQNAMNHNIVCASEELGLPVSVDDAMDWIETLDS